MSEPELNRIHQGDCVEFLRSLPAESVQCCVTSPPYWGLRVYGTPPTVWGGDEGCEHEWQKAPVMAKESSWDTFFCIKCGAWRGHYGLEPTLELYVEHTVMWCRELRRALRDDGTFWLNLGDAYAHGKPGGGSVFENGRTDGRLSYETDNVRGRTKQPTLSAGLKPKDLCGVPWRVALALQADGCDLAGGEKDYGKGPGGVKHHTANERLQAAAKGLTLSDELAGQEVLWG